MGNMQVGSLDPANFQPGERVFDPKHPEKSNIKITVESDSRIAGSIHLSRLLTEYLMNGGYANVFKSGPCESPTRVTFDNLEIATMCGTTPDLKDLQKKVTVEVHTTCPKSRDFELSFVQALTMAEHGVRITRDGWNNEKMTRFVVRSDYVQDSELATWAWNGNNLKIALAERQKGTPIYFFVTRFTSDGRLWPLFFTADNAEMAMHDWRVVAQK